MDWIEVTAPSVDEAKELALDRLGVVEDELEYEVLDEPRSGLFGRLGRVDARIRARVKPLSREKPADRRRRRGASERAAGRRGTPSRDRADLGAEPTTVGRADALTATSGAPRRRGRGRGRGAGAAGRDVGEYRAPGAGNERVEAGVDRDVIPVTEQAQQAAAFAEELVRRMGFDGLIDTDVSDDTVTVRIDGDGLGPLVGPRGVTLHAIEELVRAVAQHQAGGHSVRIHVDVAGYRERRRVALAEFATQVAREVREGGVERALEPMSPPDRKVVHDAVAELEGVATVSQGEEPRRRVVIRPE